MMLDKGLKLAVTTLKYSLSLLIYSVSVGVQKTVVSACKRRHILLYSTRQHDPDLLPLHHSLFCKQQEYEY